MFGSVEVAAPGFGCSGLMGAGRTQDRDRLLGTVVEVGIGHVDVARQYGAGYAESALGRFLRKYPRRPFSVATKFGILPMSFSSAMARRALERRAPRTAARILQRASRVARSFSVESSDRSIKDSLRALAIDYFDILFLHDCTVAEAMSPEMLEFVDGLLCSGITRRVGIASSASTVMTVMNTPEPTPYSCFQFENNLLHSNRSLLAGAREAGSVFTHRPLLHSLSAMEEVLRDRNAACAAWMKRYELDLRRQEVLARVLLSFASLSNPGGTVLFSTTDAGRLRANAELCRQPCIGNEAARALENIVEGFDVKS